MSFRFVTSIAMHIRRSALNESGVPVFFKMRYFQLVFDKVWHMAHCKLQHYVVRLKYRDLQSGGFYSMSIEEQKWAIWVPLWTAKRPIHFPSR